MSSCGIVVGPSAAQEAVQNGITAWGNMVEQAMELTNQQLDLFGQLDVDMTPINVTFDTPADYGTNLTPGNTPNVPNVSFVQPGAPVAPDSSIAQPNLPAAPDEDYAAPSINLPTPPTPIETLDFGVPPTLTDTTLPTEPTLTYPTLPTLRELDLPDVPVLPLRTFDGTAPTIGFAVPGDSFSYSESAYSSALLTELQSTASRMLAGEIGLPDTIWDKIWDRGRTQIEALANTRISEIERDAARRGFEVIPGVVEAQLEAARQEAQNKVSEFTAEKTTERARMQEEAVRFAVQQVAAIEGILINEYSQRMSRALDAEKFAFQVTIEIFNANVALFNARQQAYATAAQVFATEIEAERQQLEKYRLQLEGQRLINELNQQDVAIYNAQLEGVKTLIEQYVAQIEAVKAIADVDRAKVESYRAKVEAIGEIVKAKVAETDVYRAQIEGELAKAQIYGTQVTAFASRVDAYATEANTTIQAKRLELDSKGLSVQAFQSNVLKYQSDIQAAIAKMNQQTDQFRAEVGLYEAESRVSALEVESDSKQIELTIAAGRVAAEIALKEANLQLEQIMRAAELDLESLKTESNLRAAMTSASLAAVSYQAQISSQGSESIDCSTRYTYSGSV